MYRAYLPKALALSLLTAGLSLAGAQQPQGQPVPDANAPQSQAPAWPNHHRMADPQRQAEFLSKKLNLSSDQAAKLEPILANRNQQMQALQSNQQLSPEERHQQMRSLNQQTRQQMAAVLSPEQMAQLKELRRHHGRHGQTEQPVENGQSPS